jgi:hypothetical protein
MMFIKHILVLSFAVLALAAPPAQPRSGICTSCFILLSTEYNADQNQINVVDVAVGLEGQNANVDT